MAGCLDGFALRQSAGFRNPFKRHPRWPNPELSAGELVESMRREACWEAGGPALQQWRILNREINEYLEECGDPALADVPFTLYMIGPMKTTSSPTIVFYSCDTVSRDMVRSTVKRSGILKRYPGFRTMAANQALGIGQPIPAMEGSDMRSRSPCLPTATTVTLQPSQRGFIGAKLQWKVQDISTQDDKLPITTAGGIIEGQGRRFVTSAAHVLDQSVRSSFRRFGVLGGLEYDIDEAESDDTELTEELSKVEITSRGSLTSESSTSVDSLGSFTSSHLACSESEIPILDNLPQEHGSISPRKEITLHGPWISSADILEPFLDIALLELPTSEAQTSVEAGTSMISDSVGDVADQLDTIEVCVMTSRDESIIGILSPSPTFVLSRSTNKMQEIWTIKCEKRLTLGDSGSWVIGVHDRKVYGHVVAISSKSSFAYIVPLKRVFKALTEKLGGEWHVGTGTESQHQNLALRETYGQQLISIGAIDRSPRIRNISLVNCGNDRVSKPLPSQDKDDPVSSFLSWRTSRESCSAGVRSLTDDGPAQYIPLSKLRDYFHHTRVECLLTALFPDRAKSQLPNPSVVLQNYLRTFAILLSIGSGGLISHFVEHEKLSDANLPYHTRPDALPPEMDVACFDRFLAEQWCFSPASMKFQNDVLLDKDCMLPLTVKTVLGRASYSNVYRVAIDHEYNDLVAKSSDHKPRKSNEFVIKTFDSASARKHYTAECQAYKRLPLAANHIIRFYGSFEHWDNLHIIYEYADQGSLQDFLIRENPPSRPRDIITLWDSLLQLLDGLAAIHDITYPSDNRSLKMAGWHHDIKPTNILLVSGNPDSGSGSSWKITDFGRSHFKQLKDGGQNRGGGKTRESQTYDAPEFGRYRQSHGASNRIDQSVDIWSLGCIFSEVATWMSNSLAGVRAYSDRRRKDYKKPIGLRGHDCFHDGENVLQTVINQHRRLVGGLKTAEDLTSDVLREIVDKMLVKAESRPTARKLLSRSRDIVNKARGRLINTRTSFARVSEPVSQTRILTTKKIYQYENLVSREQGNAIRLLEIEVASSPSDELGVRLHHFDLENAPSYEALSYAWGANERPRRICCNGGGMDVTENLYQALRMIQSVDNARGHPFHPKYLWIDALCINQADNNERASQVRAMHQIYATASNVIVWLGKFDDSPESLSILPILEERVKNFSHLIDDSTLSRKSLKRSFKVKMSPRHHSDHYAIQKFFNLPWFRRAWVLQEVTVAKALKVFWGNHMIDWQSITDTAMLHALTGNSMAVGADLQAMIMPISVHYLRHRLEKKHQISLSQLLTGMRFLVSIDPRDKVYAVSRLATDTAGRKVRIDYATTIHQLYIRTAYDILQSEANFDLFSIPKGSLPTEASTSTAKDVGDLPTWVMDWRTISSVLPIVKDKFKRDFRACGNSSFFCKINLDDSLQLKGVIVAQVRATTAVWPTMDFPEIELLLGRRRLAVQEEWEAFAMETIPGPYSPAGEDWVDVYIQSLLVGNPNGQHSLQGSTTPDWTPTQIDKKAVRRQFSSFIARRPLFSRAWSKLTLGINDFSCLNPSPLGAAIGRRLAAFQPGMLALVPGACLPGDLIFIAQGGRLPLIIRESRPGVYELIGDAYIHGMMHGEAWDAANLEDIKLV